MDQNNTPTPPLTLESIAQQKKELRQAILQQKEVMTELTRSLVAPLAPATSKTDAIMRAFNTGMAVFDGAMMGLKLMKRLRRFLRKY